MEEVADFEALTEVYQRLSFLMYARFLGVEMETTRRALPRNARKSKRLIVPMTNFIRRISRPPKPPRLDRQGQPVRSQAPARALREHGRTITAGRRVRPAT